MTVSVVVPVKNEEKIICRAIQELRQQSMPPTEIIVVDNGCTDRTIALVESVSSTLDSSGIKLQILYCPYGNQIEARQMGFTAAHGEIIVSIDADTRPKKNWIKFAIDYFAKYPQIVAIGGRHLYHNFFLTVFHGVVFLYYLLRPKNYFFYGSAAAFRRDALARSDGLKNCRKIFELLALHEPHDDIFLSWQLKKVGAVRPVFGLKAVAALRDYEDNLSWLGIAKRVIWQTRDTKKLQEYLSLHPDT